VCSKLPLTLLTIPVKLRRCIKIHISKAFVSLLFDHCMFRPNRLPSSDVQAVGETAAPLSRCYTLHFKGVKYLKRYFNFFLISYHNYFVVRTCYGSGVYFCWCWFIFGAVCRQDSSTCLLHICNFYWNPTEMMHEFLICISRPQNPRFDLQQHLSSQTATALITSSHYTWKRHNSWL
jgi:hypothetical protein